MERRFPINHSRGQLREVEAETRRRQWLPFFQSVWVCHAAGGQLIYWSVCLYCGQSEDEPDCTGLCLLLTFLVITVIVIIVIVIIYFFFLPTITHLFVCRSNDGTCEVSWKMLCSALWKRVEGLYNKPLASSMFFVFLTS